MAIIAFAVLALGVRTLRVPGVVGGTTNFDTISVTGLQVGTSGSTLTQQLSGTVSCTGSATVAAGSKAGYDCAITGVVSGDKVFMTLTTPVSNIFIAGASASSTSGYVTLTLGNASSTAAVAPTGATSSVQYLIVR